MQISASTVVISVGDLRHFGADPDPTPDPTPFFIDLNDEKKNIFFSYFFHIFFLYLAHRHIIFCILQALFQCAQHIYEKREGFGSGSVPLTDGDPGLDPGGPKACGSCGS